MNIHDQIVEIFEENGVDVENADSFNNIESIQYISIIVDIEQKFDVSLPDYILTRDDILNFDQFADIVKEVITVSDNT